MRVYRFVMGPEQAKVAYDPVGTFSLRLGLALEGFLLGYGTYPNACYVSLRFPGELPEPLYLGGERLRFRRQTLLAEDEVLLGVEIETTLGEGDDGQFDERAVG